MIDRPPGDWRDLQRRVDRIFRECGFASETDKNVQLVSRTINVDVYSEDQRTQPRTISVTECKHWQSNVPRTRIERGESLQGCSKNVHGAIK